MVKHTVLFQLRADLEPQQKTEVMECFRKGIMELPAQIACIRHIEVGFNINPEEKFDIALCGEFDTLADVDAYARHPLHVAVAAQLKPYVSARSCTDYEI